MPISRQPPSYTENLTSFLPGARWAREGPARLAAGARSGPRRVVHGLRPTGLPLSPHLGTDLGRIWARALTGAIQPSCLRFLGSAETVLDAPRLPKVRRP